MVLPIYLYNSLILRETCSDIEHGMPELKELIENMFETMYNANGVGLAAPQVGYSLNLFVVDAKPMLEDSSIKEFRKVFINPKIIEYSGELVFFREGCLSIPDINEDVERQSKIIIKYFDENFNEHIEELDEMPARVVQHEYDHIQGILFIDHLSPLRKKLIKKRISLIAQGKYTPFYKSKLK